MMNYDYSNSNISNTLANYVLVVNSDIAFYPGVLKKISNNMERCISHVENFGKINVFIINLFNYIKQ